MKIVSSTEEVQEKAGGEEKKQRSCLKPLVIREGDEIVAVKNRWNLNM